MGGNYGDGCGSSCRSSYVQTDDVETLVEKFFSSGKREHLISAAKKYLNGSYEKGLIRYVLDAADVSEATNEFPGIEIESKLEISFAQAQSDGAQRSFELSDILDVIEFPPSKNARFVKDPCNLESAGTNYFYGSDDGAERVTVIHKGGNFYLKQKGDVQPYSFGIAGEQFVLRRPETREPTTPPEIMDALQKYQHDGIKYQGKIEKKKAEAFVLQTLSGRIYSLVVSDARRNLDEKEQWQLEIEYAGYIPGFKTNVGREEEIVDDIVTLMKHVCFFYNNLPLDSGELVSFAPTTERKYDFIRGVKVDGDGSRNGRTNGKAQTAIDEDFGLLSELQGGLQMKALTATTSRIPRDSKKE